MYFPPHHICIISLPINLPVVHITHLVEQQMEVMTSCHMHNQMHVAIKKRNERKTFHTALRKAGKDASKLKYKGVSLLCMHFC